METGFPKQLELADVREAKELVDESGIRARGHDTAAVLVVVEEPHPPNVEVPPGNFLLGAPVKPIRAMRIPAGLVEIHHAGQRVLVVPFGLASPHHVTARLVDGHGGIDAETKFEELIQQCVPLLAAGLVDLVPQTRDVTEAILLVVVVVVERPVLDAVFVQHRFEEPVVVGHHVETDAGGVDGTHAADAHLAQVGHSAQTVLVSLIDQGFHDLRVVRTELQAIDLLTVDLPLRRPSNPFTRRFPIR